jgi:hypothetical protein
VTLARSATAALCLLASTESFAATFNVTNENASGPGSLAQAITSANATAAADTITFQVFDLQGVVITGDLPAITQPLTIDGYSQLFSSVNTTDLFATNANILIALDGSGLPAGEAVLQIEAGPTIIKGLEIRGIVAGGYGIRVASGATGVSIHGNFIGTDGTADLSSGTGIRVDSTATIGSDAEADRNLISGNDEGGIVLRGPSSDVRNNLIGGDAAGLEGLGNGAGIIMATAAATGNSIGGTTQSRFNFIHANTLDGIRIESSAGDGNAIRGNSIFNNEGLGIDLGDDFVTLNDEDDLDSGPNELQNFPELFFARNNDTDLHVSGLLNSRPGDYEISIYLAPPGEPSGFGEGAAVLGSFPLTIEAGETIATFDRVFSLVSVPGEEIDISATARGLTSGNTSEFSRQLRVMFGGIERVVTNTNDSGAGSLRQAVEDAKNNAGPDTIVFDIPGPGPHTITPSSGFGLPAQTIVDGYTQPLSAPNTLLEGSNADIRIVIDGSQLADLTAYGFLLGGSDSAVRGVAIHSSKRYGISGTTGFRQRIEGNFIGMDASGEVDLGNEFSGIYLRDNADALIGGPTRGQRNVVSANKEAGVAVLGPRASILNNIIGLSASLEPGFGNGWDGVMLSGSDARVGSDEPELGNVIHGNVSSGIALLGSGGDGNEILGNRIDDNGELGIDLARGLVTANDLNDADAGANELQNFPVIENVMQNGDEVTVEGYLDVPAGADGKVYTIRVFASPSCNPLGHGEGATFLGFAIVGFSGDDEQFAMSSKYDFADGAVFTATATDRTFHNTSEFSACFDYGASDVLCGDYNEDGDVTASDALSVLRVAVGSVSCEACICDVNDAGGITTTDALFVLRKAVGQNVAMNCPDCS